MSVEIEDTWNFFIPLFPGYRKKVSNKEIPDYKSSKNPGWNEGGKVGCWVILTDKLAKMKAE